MAIFYLILALVISTIAVIFALQNTMMVTISFLSWTATGSLSLVLLVTIAIGVVIGLLVFAPSVIRKTLKVSSQSKRINALENEVDQQKTIIAGLQKPSPVSSSDAALSGQQLQPQKHIQDL
jgi:uncharacterized membrane protein YciS (DUF1049 family)